MNETETQLLNELRALDSAVRTQRVDKRAPDIRPYLIEIDRLALALLPKIDPELRHFLERRSYEKAQLFLEGRLAEIPRAGCTRRAT